MEKARVCFRMWPEELIDEEPLYENCEIHGCDEIEVFVREFFPPEIIQSYCPFKICMCGAVVSFCCCLNELSYSNHNCLNCLVDGSYCYYLLRPTFRLNQSDEASP